MPFIPASHPFKNPTPHQLNATLLHMAQGHTTYLHSATRTQLAGMLSSLLNTFHETCCPTLPIEEFISEITGIPEKEDTHQDEIDDAANNHGQDRTPSFGPPEGPGFDE